LKSRPNFLLSKIILCLVGSTLAISACGTVETQSTDETLTSISVDHAGSSTFRAEVWADNWFSLYVNGQLVGEDSVSITTERSFNSELITFEATYPLMIAMVTKDFKETDSGLEYIGDSKQQMGDGGFIAQFTDMSTGVVVATTSKNWQGLVIQTAPLNVECEKSSDPNTDCRFENLEEPKGWVEPNFDDSTWVDASTYTAEEVGTKDGYDTINWDASAKLIWGSNLKTQNTILWRFLIQ
jgi:hypothetical protein